MLPINVFTTTISSDQSTTELNGGFVHSLLLIDVLLRMKFHPEDKQQLIEHCRYEYRDDPDQLDIIEDFDRTYSPSHALRWYAGNSFVHRMLNKALRQQDIELLFLFRFLIRDIHKQLKCSQYSRSIRVYRGQAIQSDELQRLRQSIGQLISINSFFSTSKLYDKAIEFLNSPDVSHDLHPVLFIIDANPNVVTTRPFADITSHSSYKEFEILFMIGCVFRLTDFQQEKRVSTIYMRLCGDDEHDTQDLFQHLKKEYAGGNQQGDLKSFGAVLHKMGKYDLAQMVYYSALNELTSGDPQFSSIYRSLGMISDDRGEYDISLKWYHAAWEIQMQNNPSDYVRIASIYCCIGVVYKKKHDYKKALDYYYKAVDLFRKNNDANHCNMASFYNNIAIVYSAQEQYKEALQFYKKALDIELKYLPEDHSDLAMSYNNIGLVHYSVHNYDRAMFYHQKSLKIKQKSLPPDHPLIATSCANIGHTYEAKNDRQQALMYFQKAADIRRKALSSDHPDRLRIEKDIQRLHSQR